MQKSIATTNLDSSNRKNLGVVIWLCLVATLVLLIIIVGGVTRLTDSGLSIAHWAPIHGVMPPLNNSDWATEFELYRKIPEYKLQNAGMNLTEFKAIFWWEWAHRLLGRIVGLVYLIPLIGFWAAKKLPKRDIPKLFAIATLIGLQGFIGWWMVSSGLQGNNLDVESYRLATHLGMAFILLGLIIGLIFDYSNYSIAKSKSKFWTLVLVLAFLQVLLGALTAGIHAGYAHNDWPTIDSRWLPQDYFALTPFWLNWIGNTQAVQFNHRILAYIIILLIVLSLLTHRDSANSLHNKFKFSAFLLVIAQAILGVLVLFTFQNHVPPDWVGIKFAVAHQGLAAIFFSAVVCTWVTSVSLKK